MALAREWDGASYDRVSAPMEAMGRAVLERLPLKGDETVLDAGCGSGRVTEALIGRLPHGHVVAVDGSAQMIEAARSRLGERAELVVAELTALELGPGRTVDAILSTATFHWIADHDALFAALRRALRPGGRLVAQCGGRGNIAAVHAAARATMAEEPFAPHFAGWRGPWNFATPEETKERLHRAGFTDVETWLQPHPVALTEDAAHEYLKTINLGAHVERLPADLQDPFVAAVHARLGAAPTIDYVRLNLDATAA